MVLLGLYVTGWATILARLERLFVPAWRAMEPLRRRVLPIDSDAKALAAGALWGFIPCGIVYSMLVLALASGTPRGGAIVMAAFGLGTAPSLLAAGFAAQRVLEARRNPWIRRGAGVAIMALAVAGFARVELTAAPGEAPYCAHDAGNAHAP
jgi:sulfite exporter TauE/SafE